MTLRWYLGWCLRNSVGCSVQSARGFIDWAQAEKKANDWMVERWREAIRWFFATEKEQRSACAEFAGDSDGESESGSDSDSDSDSGSESELYAAICNGAEGSPMIAGGNYGALNDTSAERIEAYTADETAILKVMRRRGMALTTERN